MIVNGNNLEEAGTGYLKIIFWDSPGETKESQKDDPAMIQTRYLPNRGLKFL
jgi:hypothetical protein